MTQHLSVNWSDTGSFNPHEREARDVKQFEVPPLIGAFNPHEREARDLEKEVRKHGRQLLIHTSVKLVTIIKFPPLLF